MKPPQLQIPITEHAVFAICVGAQEKRETILIGEKTEVEKHLRGHASANLLFSAGREAGLFVQCFEPCTIRLADITVALCNSAARRESYLFQQKMDDLESLYASDNPVYRFTALLMWQEYRRALKDKKAAEALRDTLEEITLPSRFHVVDSVLRWQKQYRHSPLGFTDNDYLKYPVSVYYDSTSGRNEYGAVDRSLLPLVVYYLKQVYEADRYLQVCPLCGKAFVAKTAGKLTLCSKACKREQTRLNKRKFDEKAREVSYERAFKNTYMYWYNKVKKHRTLGDLPRARQDALEAAFSAFTEESAARKKKVTRGGADANEYESWLLGQRDVIDDLLMELEGRPKR